jgi:hypothetical protein
MNTCTNSWQAAMRLCLRDLFFSPDSVMRTVAAWTADMARPADPPGSTSAAIEERATAAAVANGERASARMRNRCGAAILARDFYGRGAVTVLPSMVEPLLIDRTKTAFTPGGGREDERGLFPDRTRWPRVEKNRMLYVSLSTAIPSEALEDVTSVPAVGFPVPLDSIGARVHPIAGGGDVLSVIAPEDGPPPRTVLVTVR